MKRIGFLILFMVCALAVRAEAYIVTANKLNVRAAASSTAKVLGSLEKGFEIDVQEVTSGGFARFNYFGKEGYVKASYLKQKEAPEATSDQVPHQKAKPAQESAPQGEATVYVFYDIEGPGDSPQFKLNGGQAFYMSGNFLKEKYSLKYYSRNMTRINVKGEGKLLLSYDFENKAGDEFHGDLPISIRDGGTYYVRIFFGNIMSLLVKKRHGWEMELLDAKKGKKLLEKFLNSKEKDRMKYKINDAIDFTL